MRTLTYALCLALVAPTLSASAGLLANDAYNLSLELQREEPYLNRGQSAQIQQRLNAIRKILRGEGIAPQPGPMRPGRDYVCVSRDNDGMNPYMIGYKDFTNVVRIPGTVVDSKEACESVLASARHQAGNALLCLSRDNDGMSPIVVGALDRHGNLTRLEKSTTSSRQACAQLLNDMRYTREGVLYCGSRDNDGMSPYVAVGYRYNGTVSVGNESFSSYPACVNSL